MRRTAPAVRTGRSGAEARGGGRVPGRLVVAVALLGAQAAMLVVGRFTDLRHFTWSPHDQRGAYAITATIDGVELDDAALWERYHISPRGLDPRAIAHVFDIVARVERSAGDDARVTIVHRVNGGEERTWSWP